MPTPMPAKVPAGVPPPLKGAIVRVADDVATVTGPTVTVADDDDCDVIIPDDAGVVGSAVDELALLPVLSAAVAAVAAAAAVAAVAAAAAVAAVAAVAEDFAITEAPLILK